MGHKPRRGFVGRVRIPAEPEPPPTKDTPRCDVCRRTICECRAPEGERH